MKTICLSTTKYYVIKYVRVRGWTDESLWGRALGARLRQNRICARCRREFGSGCRHRKAGAADVNDASAGQLQVMLHEGEIAETCETRK